MAALAGACTRSQPAPSSTGRPSGPGATAALPSAGAIVLGTFEGTVDGTGRLSVTRTMDGSSPGALTAILPHSDGLPGVGPDDTIELVTTTEPAPGYVAAGCADGVTDAFEGSVTIRSFHVWQTHWNVYVEITEVPTGHEVCNSASAISDLNSRGLGLWRYGTLAPAGGTSTTPDAATVRWKFKAAASDAFPFKGRILAMPGPAFDFTPDVLATPARTFVPLATATAALRFNGTTWVDPLGAVSLTAVDSPTSGSIGLLATPDHYAAGFSATSYYRATLPANALDTTGDFTVCAKIKPGAHPGSGEQKVLVARGIPDGALAGGGDGWALTQEAGRYAFQFRLGGGSIVKAQLSPGAIADGDTTSADPSGWAFDYVCGGRSGSGIQVGVHGQFLSSTASLGSAAALADPATLTIGAFDGGLNPATDAGVYEVIFDRRAASGAVMNELVAMAEEAPLANAVSGSSTRVLRFYPAPAEVTGYGGLTYTLPPYATPPPPAGDLSSGLVPGSVYLEYSHPALPAPLESSRQVGYCIGAEVAVLGRWADAGSPMDGGVLQWGERGVEDASLMLTSDASGVEFWLTFGGSDEVRARVSDTSTWGDGSAHLFMGCVDPEVATTRYLRFYVDGVRQTEGTKPEHLFASAWPLLDLSHAKAVIGIGNALDGLTFPLDGAPPAHKQPLTGGVIKRVIFCPSSDPELCRRP